MLGQDVDVRSRRVVAVLPAAREARSTRDRLDHAPGPALEGRGNDGPRRVRDGELERLREGVDSGAGERPVRAHVVARAGHRKAARHGLRRLGIDPHDEPVAARRTAPGSGRNGDRPFAVRRRQRDRRRRRRVLLDPWVVQTGEAPDGEVHGDPATVARHVFQLADERMWPGCEGRRVRRRGTGKERGRRGGAVDRRIRDAGEVLGRRDDE